MTLKDKGAASNKIEYVVRRWLVLTILTGRYSGPPESMFNYDSKRVREAEEPLQYVIHTEEGELSDAFWNNILVTRLNMSVASSPCFNVFLMVQIKMRDKGFLSEQIDVKSLIEPRGGIYHIFLKKYLQKNGLNNRSISNQITSYVYTQS